MESSDDQVSTVAPVESGAVKAAVIAKDMLITDGPDVPQPTKDSDLKSPEPKLNGDPSAESNITEIEEEDLLSTDEPVANGISSDKLNETPVIDNQTVDESSESEISKGANGDNKSTDSELVVKEMNSKSNTIVNGSLDKPSNDDTVKTLKENGDIITVKDPKCVVEEDETKTVNGKTAKCVVEEDETKNESKIVNGKTENDDYTILKNKAEESKKCDTETSVNSSKTDTDATDKVDKLVESSDSKQPSDKPNGNFAPANSEQSKSELSKDSPIKETNCKETNCKDNITDVKDNVTQSSSRESVNVTQSSPSESVNVTQSSSSVSVNVTQSSSSESVNVTQSSSSVSVNVVPSSSSESVSSDQTVEKITKFRCPKCSKVIKDERLVATHICDIEDLAESKYQITIVTDKEKAGAFVCKECDVSNSGHGFEEHLMCHLMIRPYQCLYCKENFINRKEISRHVLKIHTGLKMSCALRALRKAKSLIKEVANTGTLTFSAKVGGKVPLEKDPDRKKKPLENPTGTCATQGVESNTADDKNVDKSTVLVSADAAKTAVDNNVDKPTSNRPVSADAPETASKLRQVLTVDDKDKVEKYKAGDKKTIQNDSGFKIVSAYSLQDPKPINEVKVNQAVPVEAPNFMAMPTPHSIEKEPELLSFLGPDKSSIPPPPLQPAPSHSTSLPLPTIPNKEKKNPHFFICGFNCLFSSICSTEFREHTSNFHSSETSYPCYYCGHSSPSENDLVRHICNHTHDHNKNSALFVCGNEGCKFGTNMTHDFINHVKNTHGHLLEPSCSSCGEAFPDVDMLKIHVEENVLHIVNCPHCPSKATDRRAIIAHISQAHPGKGKMVSVAKQLICLDRKLNNYQEMIQMREMLPPALMPAPALSRGPPHDQHSDNFRGTPSPSSRLLSPSPRGSSRSPGSESSGFGSIQIKDEVQENAFGVPRVLENDPAYTIDEFGVRRRAYVPMSERQAENYKCRYCTFISRDLKRQNCHERSHSMPPTKKERFKCMFCPQGFDSEMKFRLHITCHPGLIKFLLYRCRKCEFDSNQKHTIIKHITCNRDRKHRGVGPVEDQYSVVQRLLETRVLQCDHCDYMTRHKIHMAIHYREHGILRDKGEFTIVGLTPTDTPMNSYDPSMIDSSPQESAKSTPSPQAFGSFQQQSPSRASPSFDFTRPTTAPKKSRDRNFEVPHLSVSQITERNENFTRLVIQQSAGQVLENQVRKFKCPICKYLLPKAADLKNHVKRHSEIGQITLVMFRCKYCSCMSTARELLYEHLAEKHQGKAICLVKKIVAIDTTEVDRSFAETSVEETFAELEENLHKEMATRLNSNGQNLQDLSGDPQVKDELVSGSFEQLFVIPEGDEVFAMPLQCPKCEFSTHHRSEITEHVTSLHPEVKVLSNDEDVEQLARATTGEINAAARSPQEGGASLSGPVSLPCQEEVLIVPDEQNFKEPALCSRCDFSTQCRRDMVLHLQQFHPEISVMGRNSYPVQVSAIGGKTRGGPVEESCVVGSGSLDAKLRCLYENYGTQMKCLICGTERPKKFFIHVHILRHLNIYLWKCAFCAHRGLQKYKMVDHIKKIHPGRPMSVRYLRVNVEAKVQQFLAQFNVIQNRKASLEGGLTVPYTGGDVEQEDKSPTNSTVTISCNSAGLVHAMGSEEMDQQVGCLYDFSDGVYYKCLICPHQFQRKFAVHRHIIITHLKVSLLSCIYCDMEGVEKHQMVDHCLACHKGQPVNIRANDVDMSSKVTEFLARVANGEEPSSQPEINSSSNMDQYGNTYHGFNKKPTKQKSPQAQGAKLQSPKFRFGHYKMYPDVPKSQEAKKKVTLVDPDVIMLGREALDRQLSSLYQIRNSGQIRCLVCRWEFPRKYPLHRHIMLKHLKMMLVGCPYCPFGGVEKYNVTAHIKEVHRGQPVSIKFIQPDVGAKVKEFVEDMAGGQGQSPSLIKKPNPSSRSSSPSVVVPKTEAEDDSDNEDRSPSGGGSLVVAMFGKKRKKVPESPLASSSEEFLVKTEVENDEYEEGDALNSDDNSALPVHFSGAGGERGEGDEVEEDNYDEDDDPGADAANYFPDEEYEGGEDGDQKFLTLKRPLAENYVPGAYRSPSGGKPKALDVITRIKVLKAKEGPITKFYCEKCNFTSLHRSNVVRHIYKIHEKYQTHICPTCNYQTLSLMLMQQHTKQEHPGQEYTPDAFTLNPPRSKPKPKMGPLSFQKRRQNMLQRNLAAAKATLEKSSSSKSSFGGGPKQFACAYCLYETDTQEDITAHTLENHGGNDDGDYDTGEDASPWGPSKKAVKRKMKGGDGDPKRKKRFIFEKGDELIQCGHCEVRETATGRMEDHLSWEHPGEEPIYKRIPSWRFVCKSCPVKTMATSKMKYHLNRHVNYRPYTCPDCGAFFPSPDQCRRHARNQGHDEQYMYARIPKKETRVEEMLEETRQLAIKVQEEAVKDPNFEITQTDVFIEQFQDLRGNLKRHAPTGPGTGSARGGKKPREGDEDGGDVKQAPSTMGVEMHVTIKCHTCEVTGSTVSEVYTHHKAAHVGEKFLWTELERGFTCDRTGEALPDSGGLPALSLDVGYSTKMTLGPASNSMRFKCKTCDFSSHVIQAMKSHLKSHQPKGFICPYCSRSFSGKEKLMRHQYCLHKGLATWVIHLRLAGVPGSISTKKSKSSTRSSVSPAKMHTRHHAELTEPFDSEAEGTDLPVGEEPESLEEDEGASSGKYLQGKNLNYLCSECDFESESLFLYRLHLSQEHPEFKHRTRDRRQHSSLKCGYCQFLAQNEAEFSAHVETHFGERRFRCSHCEYSAFDRQSANRHVQKIHVNTDGIPMAKVVDLNEDPKPENLDSALVEDNEEGSLPLVVNLEPEVKMRRISKSVLSQLSSAMSEEEEGEGESATAVDQADDSNMSPVSDIGQDDDSSVGRKPLVEDISESGSLQLDPEEEEHDVSAHMSDSADVSEADVDDNAKLLSELRQFEEPEKVEPLVICNIPVAPPHKTKDTLLSAQDEDEPNITDDEHGQLDDDDDNDDDDDDDTFGKDVTLSSPLPMISLGDGVDVGEDPRLCMDI